MKRIITILIIMISWGAFSQSNYLVEREDLYMQGKEFLALDKEYSLDNGEILPALIVKELGSTSTTIKYQTFRYVNPEKVEMILDRLKTSVPSIQSINYTSETFIVRFSNPMNEEDLIELLRLTGYKGYKVMQAN